MYLLILLAVSLLISSIGFIKYIYFLSVGYGLAVAGLGATMLILFKGSAGEKLLCILLMIYGLRLSGFLLYREFRTGSYKKTFTELMKSESRMPLFVKVVMWISVAILYVMQVSPVYFRMAKPHTGNIGMIIGIIVMVLGIIIESLADYQKSAAKKIAPQSFVDTGLYRYVRCPNYFGEILFWTGVLISGAGALVGWQWLMAVFGYVAIVYIMLGGARRLEIKQDARYGDDMDYRLYVSKTPIIIPGLPLYHLRDMTFLK